MVQRSWSWPLAIARTERWPLTSNSHDGTWFEVKQQIFSLIWFGGHLSPHVRKVRQVAGQDAGSLSKEPLKCSLPTRVRDGGA